MKNKPVETRKKKGKEEGKRERGRERRTQRHRDAYAITPTERFKFSPNYWAVFHVVRASKLSLPFILIFPLGSTCFISLFLSLLYVYLYVISSSYFLSLSLSLFFSRLSLSSHLWNKSRSSEHKGKLPSTSFMARRFIASFSFSGSPWIAPEENDQRCRNRKNIAKEKLKRNAWQGKGKSSMAIARIVF